MTDLNKVMIIGRLTRDAEEKKFDNGGSILNISIAVNRSVKKGEQWVDEASFLEVRYSVKTGSKMIANLCKGKQIGVSGSLKQERWESNGQKNSRIVIAADNIQLLGGQGSQSGNPVSNTPASAQAVADAFDGEAFPEDLF